MKQVGFRNKWVLEHNVGLTLKIVGVVNTLIYSRAVEIFFYKIKKDVN
jgi:hypothetical protein